MEYLVVSDGLSGHCSYQATNPDEALMFAYRHERFLRAIKRGIPPGKAGEIAKDECAMPDFHISLVRLER